MQCEQTEQKNGVPSGCTVAGVCGKSPEVSIHKCIEKFGSTKIRQQRRNFSNT